MEFAEFKQKYVDLLKEGASVKATDEQQDELLQLAHPAQVIDTGFVDRPTKDINAGLADS